METLGLRDSFYPASDSATVLHDTAQPGCSRGEDMEILEDFTHRDNSV